MQSHARYCRCVCIQRGLMFRVWLMLQDLDRDHSLTSLLTVEWWDFIVSDDNIRQNPSYKVHLIFYAVYLSYEIWYAEIHIIIQWALQLVGNSIQNYKRAADTKCCIKKNCVDWLWFIHWNTLYSVCHEVIGMLCQLHKVCHQFKSCRICPQCYLYLKYTAYRHLPLYLNMTHQFWF